MVILSAAPRFRQENGNHESDGIPGKIPDKFDVRSMVYIGGEALGVRSALMGGAAFQGALRAHI